MLSYIKNILTRLGELIIFEAWRENDHFSQSIQIFLIYGNTIYVFYYLSTSDLLSFIIFITDKHEFSSIWKWISCCNDVIEGYGFVLRQVFIMEAFLCLRSSFWKLLGSASMNTSFHLRTFPKNKEFVPPFAVTCVAFDVLTAFLQRQTQKMISEAINIS